MSSCRWRTWITWQRCMSMRNSCRYWQLNLPSMQARWVARWTRGRAPPTLRSYSIFSWHLCLAGLWSLCRSTTSSVRREVMLRIRRWRRWSYYRSSKSRRKPRAHGKRWGLTIWSLLELLPIPREACNSTFYRGNTTFAKVSWFLQHRTAPCNSRANWWAVTKR